jgi:curved DNA-binding protein CbpA
VPTRVRDWATVDYYEMLGVSTTASGDDIARAFRTAAKQSHPDATDDPEAAERFKDLAAAYTVLSDRRTRRDYDLVRAGASPVTVRPPTRPAPMRTASGKPTRWTRKWSWIACVGGLICVVLGVFASVGTLMLHNSDASQRARYVPVLAQRIDNGQITFQTRDAQGIITKEPQQHGEGSGLGPTVKVRYDPANPAHVIVDSDTLGRDITFAAIALKLLIGGAVFAILGARHLRQDTAAVATGAR